MEQKVRCLRKHSTKWRKNSDVDVNIRQNGTKTSLFTSTSYFAERKLRCLHKLSTKWHEKPDVYANIGFFGAKNAAGMGFSMKSAGIHRNSSNLWQKYATAKVGAMVIHGLDMAGMCQWCRFLAT